MTRVMIIGYGPLPRPGTQYTSSVVLRTRHLFKPLVEAGLTVNLYTLPIPGSEGPEGEVAAMTPDHYEGFTYQRFTNHSAEFAIQTLTEQARQLEPDALVGVNTYPSYIGAMIPTTIPLWADLNGYWMAEMQGRCSVEKDDSMLADAWAIERVIARRLDKFSAVSRPQLHAVLGEMASIGRLNQHTFQYQFGHHLPNAHYRWEAPPPTEGEAAPGPVLRGPLVPPEAFVILWSGGFNVWCDIPNLVKAMDTLMERHPEVHFVSTGGRIEGVVTQVYQTFEELVEQSPYTERYHLLGWVESEKLPSIYREADLGINVDSINYETLFGARNRINAMAAEDLPVASTLGTEISEWLNDGQAIISAPMREPQVLAKKISRLIEHRDRLRQLAENARRIMEHDFSYEATTRHLLNWLKAPQLAPDNQAKLDGAVEPVTDLAAIAGNSLEEEAMLLARHRPKEIMRALAEHQTQPARGGGGRKFKFWRT